MTEQEKAARFKNRDIMPICITTSGRADRQITLDSIRPMLRVKGFHVYLVVQEKEQKLYAKHGVPMLIVPKFITTLSPTREWLGAKLIVMGYKKMIMLDDDLTFTRRTFGTGVRLHQLENLEIVEMFRKMVRGLQKYKHVAISAREGNNRVEASYARCTRAMRCVGFDLWEYRSIDPPLSRLVAMSDFDATLRLLCNGHPNVVYYDWAQNQSGGSNAPGGCSRYRTKEVLAEAAAKLAKSYPDFVALATRKTEGSWGGGERTDVTVYWKKAYRSSIEELLS